MSNFGWNEAKIEAAQLIATGELSERQLAERIGVDRRTLYRWRHHPEFQARVEEELQTIRDALRHQKIGMREQRVAALNRRWLALQEIIAERGADPRMARAPGGRTGLLVRTKKALGARVVEEFQLDGALLRELREIERAAAEELGQRIDRLAVQTDHDEPTMAPGAAEAMLKALNDWHDGAGAEAEDSEGAA